MSKGLGWLQREIVGTLIEAKASGMPYRGSGEGWIQTGYRRRFRLDSSVFDLRASLKYLARKHGLVCQRDYARPAFQTAFSRAAKSLIERELIEAPRLVPITESDPPDACIQCSDGLYIWQPKQVRFVRRNRAQSTFVEKHSA